MLWKGASLYPHSSFDFAKVRNDHAGNTLGLSTGEKISYQCRDFGFGVTGNVKPFDTGVFKAEPVVLVADEAMGLEFNLLHGSFKRDFTFKVKPI